MSGSLEGLVVYKSSRNVRVRVSGGVLLCSVRGRFRESGTGRLPVVVGDRVVVRSTVEGEGVIERILDRRSELCRARAVSGRPPPAWKVKARPSLRCEERVVAANVDQALIVLAARLPPPRWGLVDRVLVSSRYEGLDGAICLNKIDQVDGDGEARAELESALGVYRELGYPVFRSSFLAGRGIEEIREWLAGRTTVLSGHSGVGKSTILNAMCPSQEAETGSISDSTGKGRHVTVATALHELPGGGWLVDTPGYREYGLIDLEASQLARYYVEFEEHVSHCRFKNCLHLDEPGCAVLAARERGEITELRYRNYRRIVSTLPGSRS